MAKGSGKGGGNKIGRDASTGHFIPVKEAKAHPKSTTVETLPRGKRGK
jgi:hypothetical protein